MRLIHATKHNGLIAGAATAALLGLIAPAAVPSAAAAASRQPARPGASTAATAVTPQPLVSGIPASGTPAFPAVTPAVEQVRQLVQCGGTMYAVGSFSTIRWAGRTFTRHNAFSFRATAPFTMTSWNPDVNGRVDSIAFNGSSCSRPFLGGSFSRVHGTTVRNLAKVRTGNGTVVRSFAHTASGEVATLVARHGHLLAGGWFTQINGSGNPYLTSLSPVTGRDDGFARLGISGNYGSGATKVYNQQVSHDGRLDLLEGTFTTAGGRPRQQIFMIRLTGRHAVVTDWTSPEFSQACSEQEQFYLRAASWSPSDRTIYVATTGFRPPTGPPNTQLCDAAAAFPARHASVRHKWVNYTGCDSLYSTAAAGQTAFFAGHERWASNRRGCDERGPGAVSAPGMVGLSPATGRVIFNPTRGRGLGADDMLLTHAGLWIASDNFDRTTKCGRVGGHAGICFLPYR